MPQSQTNPWYHKEEILEHGQTKTHKVMAILIFISGINKTSKYFKANKNSSSHDVVSGSDKTPCNRMNKPLVVYRFSGMVVMSSTT